VLPSCYKLLQVGIGYEAKAKQNNNVLFQTRVVVRMEGKSRTRLVKGLNR